jgi:hypothetical protein
MVRPATSPSTPTRDSRDLRHASGHAPTSSQRCCVARLIGIGISVPGGAVPTDMVFKVRRSLGHGHELNLSPSHTDTAHRHRLIDNT